MSCNQSGNMSCKIIDCKMLFDAIRTKEDDYWKAATIINLDIPYQNKIKLADVMIKKPAAYKWFEVKLDEYEGGDDDYT